LPTFVRFFDEKTVASLAQIITIVSYPGAFKNKVWPFVAE
jgi:hypothetical protein